MKKDKLIQQKLNKYADGLKLSPSLIEDALVEVRRNRARAAARFSRGRFFTFAALAAAAALIVAFALGALGLLKRGTAPDIARYSLSDLGRKSIELEEIPRVSPAVAYLDLNGMAAECSLLFDRKTKEPVMVYAKYKVLGAGGSDELVLIADLKRGFLDLEGFKSLAKKDIRGVEVRFLQYYEDGEYHTNAYFYKGGVDYYLIAMSPRPDIGYHYIEILLES